MQKLKAGDILVFKAGDDWIGKSIAWLTDSDVSHAALMLEGGQMTEMGASGIQCETVEALEGSGALLLRFSPDKDPAPVLAAAQKYIDSETRYDFPALVFLAGLIIYRKIRPTQKLVKIIDIILRAACVAADKLIQKLILHNSDKTMVCSQLVYQVYEDCGKEYHIELKGGLFQSTNVSDQADGTICLAELAKDASGLDFAMTVGEEVFPETSELAKALCQAFEEEQAGDSAAAVSVNLGALPAWAGRFLEKLEDFLEKSGSLLPIDAMFVAPSDLAYKAVNLQLLGELKVKRT